MILPTTGRYFQVPYRNLRAEGRAQPAGRRPVDRAGTGSPHASTRNMSCCAVLGQGAGVAAALSVHCGFDLDSPDIDAIQKELDRQGVRYT